MPNLKPLASDIAEILKRNPKMLGVFIAQGHAHFSFVCDFMLGLGLPQRLAKSEVSTFSR